MAAFSGEIPVAIENATRRLYGVQFHPEVPRTAESNACAHGTRYTVVVLVASAGAVQVDLSTDGMALFKNFLFGIAELTPTFTMVDRRTAAIAEIRAIVGEDEAGRVIATHHAHCASLPRGVCACAPVRACMQCPSSAERVRMSVIRTGARGCTGRCSHS